MTPKEKALELCQRFAYLSKKWEQTDYRTMTLENAKQCALLTVDELILDTDASSPFEELRLKFWQEVKSEIEKL